MYEHIYFKLSDTTIIITRGKNENNDLACPFTVPFSPHYDRKDTTLYICVKKENTLRE